MGTVAVSGIESRGCRMVAIGIRDEFHLTAIVQNLKRSGPKLAKCLKVRIGALSLNEAPAACSQLNGPQTPFKKTAFFDSIGSFATKMPRPS
jgi:hypothetical protein